ncbi:MAG: MerR family transcriptional regulator [Candidatus Latescibacterota bacterium]
MNNDQKKFTLDELCALADVSRRTARFYIQQGLLDRPEGTPGRGAFYSRRHLEQLLTIRRWQDAGLSLDRIREILHEEAVEGPIPPPRPPRAGTVGVWSRVTISEGIELHIEPGRAGLSPEQVREFLDAVVRAYQTLLHDTTADE